LKEIRRVLASRDDAEPDLPPLVGTFLRGLSIGALVGAAIAGSALLRRRAGRGADPDQPKRVGPPEAVQSQ
jgi:hypothetical protein